MPGLRRVVRRVHLCLGLGLGALMALAGLTGAVLVFYVEIDRALHPELAVAGSADARSWDRALATVRAAYPGKTGPWRFEVTGRPGAIPARYYNPPETAGRDFAPMLVWLSPDGRRVLRRDYWGDTAMTWIYDLHYRLQLGKPGGEVFGWAGLALLALLLSGLWAWWPRGRWAKAMRFKRGAVPVRRLHDWHKLAGLAGMPLLLVLTGTGVMLALPHESDAVLAATLGPVAPMPMVHARAAGGAPISAARAVAVARFALPHARLRWIEVPGDDGHGVFRLRMQQPSDPGARFPHSFVHVDPASGRVLAISDAERAGASNTVNAWLHPLHDGSAGGMVLRVLTVLAGLAGAALFVTGLWRWLVRRRPHGPRGAVALDQGGRAAGRP